MTTISIKFIGYNKIQQDNEYLVFKRVLEIMKYL